MWASSTVEICSRSSTSSARSTPASLARRRIAGDPADRAAAFRRDIDEIVAPSRSGAGGEIEAEAQFLQQPQFKAHHQRPGNLRLAQMLDDDLHGAEQFEMTVAFGQQAQMAGEKLNAVDAGGMFHQPGGG